MRYTPSVLGRLFLFRLAGNSGLFLPCLVSLCVLAVSATATLGVDKFPEPSPYPISWQFKFEHGTPKRLVVDVPGSSHPVAYWYMTYTVSNPGDKAQNFVPQFEMLSDDGRVTRSDLAIPAEVFHQIKVREGTKMLMDSHKIEGALNPGDDEAKDGVAIWPEPMLRMGSFSIFVGGLSGEYLEMKDANGKPMIKKDPASGQESPLILHKVLQLTYHLASGEARPGEDDDHPEVEHWIMR